jgi:predicted ribosome quality control (RQC) complex YloA/Tae2 family protein
MLTNYYTLLKITEELKLLIGCKLIEITSQEKDSLDFTFFDSENLHFLHFSGISNYEIIFYSDSFHKKKSNAVVLFEDIYGDIVQEILLLPKTRILQIKFVHHYLFIQLFGGSRNNVIITDKKLKIQNSLTNSRELIGKKFEFPDPNLFSLDSLPSDLEILKAISYSEELLGKHYAEELLINQKIYPKTKVNLFSKTDLESIFNEVRRVAQKLIHQENYYILKNSEGKKLFSLSRLSKFDEIVKESASPSELIKHILSERLRDKFFQEKYKKYYSIAESDFKNCQRQVESLKNEDLKKSLIEKYNLFAELLFSSPQIKEKGRTEIILNDYQGNSIKIELNPKYSIIENAENYFKKVKKLKISLKVASEREDEINRKYEIALNKILELKEIRNIKELKLHILNHHKFYQSRMEKEEKEISERFKVFELSEEAILYVGKEAKNNDELTFGFGKPNDYWFHLRGGSGSHCILKYTGKGNPSKEFIEKAASIAAYYSSQRNGGFVPVVYTQRKYVRKPKGANPGAVIISKENVVLVEPKIEF